MPIKPRESKFPEVSLFCFQRSWACGWDCTTTTQHELNSSSCKHLLFCAFSLWEISVHITEAWASISLVRVYYPPVFPVWNTHKKCPWTCLFWEPNRAHPKFFMSNLSKHPWRLSSVEDKHLICPETERSNCILLHKKIVNITIFKKIKIKIFFKSVASLYAKCKKELKYTHSVNQWDYRIIYFNISVPEQPR